MDIGLYNQLQKAASTEGTVFYSDLALTLGLNMQSPEDRNRMSFLLDEISIYEHSHGRPLLSVVVVHKDDDRMPGQGFFSMAKRVGLFQTNDRIAFFSEELRRVYNHWSVKSDVI